MAKKDESKKNQLLIKKLQKEIIALREYQASKHSLNILK